MKQLRSNTLAALALCLLLCSLVVFVFGQSSLFDFTAYDDPKWVSENPVVQAGLSLTGVQYAFGETILGHWAPLTVLSHMAVCQQWGLNAGAHHLVNVGLHALGAALLFLALWRLTGAMGRSVAVAAFFAVHPLRAESVMWITERKDVLSGAFFFLALWAYRSWVRRGGGVRYLSVLIFTACGLLSKSMLVTLPFVLLLLDYWPLRRGKGAVDWKRCIVEKLPIFALALGMAALQYRLAKTMLMPIGEIGWPARIGNAVVTYAVYVGQLFWADSLAVFYPHPGAPPLWQLLAGVTTLIIVTGIVWKYGREHRYLWAGWLWYLGMLVPVVGLVQSGGLARADRYTYLPHVGLLIMVVWGLADLSVRWQRRRWYLGGAVAAGLAMAVVSARFQAATWRNEETLWTRALAVTKGNYHAHINLGLVEERKGNFPAAISHYREAVKVGAGLWSAHANLGMALLATGDAEGAFTEAVEAIRLNPGQTAVAFGRSFRAAGMLPAAGWCIQQALIARPDDIGAELELASIRGQQGAFAESVHSYEAVLRRQPGRIEALIGLGHVLAELGRIDEAIGFLETVVAHQPAEATAWYYLADARLMQGRSALAVEFYRKALACQPGMVEAQANLAWLLATSVEDKLRNGPEAVQWARSASESSSDSDASILRILAAAHAEAGQYLEAVATIERAIRIAQKQGDPNFVARLVAQRDLYRSNVPLRVPIRPAQGPL